MYEGEREIFEGACEGGISESWGPEEHRIQDVRLNMSVKLRGQCLIYYIPPLVTQDGTLPVQNPLKLQILVLDPINSYPLLHS